jgi:hypothetical protein
MWRNFKRMVLYMYNRPCVDFATYALVTQALQLYQVKFNMFMDNPRKGRTASLTGEQAPIKKAWLLLRTREIKGQYNTNVYQWTCSCGAQNTIPIFCANTLCNRCLALHLTGGYQLYGSTLHPSMIFVNSYLLETKHRYQRRRNSAITPGSLEHNQIMRPLLWPPQTQ